MAKGSGVRINIGAVGTNQTVQAIQKVGTSAKALTKAFSKVAVAVGVIKGIGAVFSKAGESIDAFNTQSEAIANLEMNLRRAGIASAQVSQAQQEFASALQATTGVADETTIALQAQALALGVSASDLNSTTQAAVGLSKALGIDLDSAMNKTIEVMKGNTNAFGDLIPEMYGVTDPMMRLQIINQLAATGLAETANQTGTLRGTMARLSGAAGDLMERFGELLEPIMILANTALSQAIEALNRGMGPAIENVASGLESIRPYITAVMQNIQDFGAMVGIVFDFVTSVVGHFVKAFYDTAVSVGGSGNIVRDVFVFLRDIIVKTMTFVEVVILNFPKIVKLAFLSAKLSLITFAEDTKHFFTVAIPAYALWFAENFTSIIRDTFVGAYTIIKNFVTNAGEALNVLFDYMTGNFIGGWEGAMDRLTDIASRSLLEGFEAQTAELPEIAARAMTDGEMKLKSEIGGIASSLGDEYNKKLADRMSRFETPEQEDLDPFGGIGFGLRTGQGTGMGRQATQLQANESRLMTRGPMQDPFKQKVMQFMQQMVDNQEQIVENTYDTQEQLDDVVKVQVVP